MKRLKFLIVLVVGCLVISACSSDDNNSNSGSEATLIGTWNGVSSVFNGQDSGIPDNSIVKFTSDNQTEFIYENFGNNNEDVIEEGSWVKNGNDLQITWDESDAGSEVYELTIIELTDSLLRWRTTIVGEGVLEETFER